jgi:hypothetical protein
MSFALIDDFDAYSKVKTKDTVAFVGAATVHSSGSCNPCVTKQSITLWWVVHS